MSSSPSCRFTAAGQSEVIKSKTHDPVAACCKDARAIALLHEDKSLKVTLNIPEIVILEIV